MHAQTLDRVTLEHDLRRAIERSELRLHYQPLVSLGTGEVVGMEALLRWEHPTRGLIPPLSFIPMAEETGLILPIGRWVIETACHRLRDWQRRHPAAAGLSISVNLSAPPVRRVGADRHDRRHPRPRRPRPGLPRAGDHRERGHGPVRGVGRAAPGLRALGVQLALDDFGTGYSSLSYLRRLPLDTIKVDRSFVSGLGTDPADTPIVQAVISLAHGLGIDVVAEGIETAAQARILQELDCDRGQGYLFSRPLPGGRDGVAARLRHRARGARRRPDAPRT